MRRGAAALLLASLAAATAARADDVQDRLRDIESQLRAGQDKLADVRARAAELTELVDRSERRRAELVTELRAARARAATVRDERRRLEREVADLTARIDAGRARGARTSAWALSLTQGGLIELLLRGEDLPARLRHAGSLRVMLDDIGALLAELAAQREELHAKEAALRERQAEAEALAKRMAALADEAGERSAQLRRTLSLVQRDERLTRDMLADLEGAQRDLLKMLQRRRSAAEGLVALDSYKGEMAAPVAGRLLMRFGRQVDPVFGVEIEHPGYTYRADVGTPVRAVAPGEVVYAGWLRGYGNLVVVQHGNEYFTLYGYLSALDVEGGARVGEGDQLGLSGDAGSLYGPALHFEIRHRRDPLDPGQWLR